MEQGNPTVSKIAAALALAGADALGAILAGLGGRFFLALGGGEVLRSWRVEAEGFEQELDWITCEGGAEANVVFGEDTATGPSAVENVVLWETNLGAGERRFWVRDLPDSGGLYAGGSDCQASAVSFYVDLSSPDPVAHTASVALNVLPGFNDEFFRQHEYSGNRYANTLRNWGGAATAQVFLGSAEVVTERPIDTLHSFLWHPSDYGVHYLVVRLRAALGSEHYVDLNGMLRARQFPED